MPEPRSVPFSMVDVFAARPLTGNPAAVVPDADGLSLEQLQALAREFNQSETVFIVAPAAEDAEWQLRSFTPMGAEVGGVGHNVLAACLWLVDRLLPVDRTGFVVQVGADLVHTEVARGEGGRATVTTRQSPPVFGSVLTDREPLADALGLTTRDLTGDAAQVVSTGAGHLLVPLVDRAAVDRAQPDTRRLASVLDSVAGEGCYLYSLDPVDGDATAYARFFNPTMGIVEDPATGTAAGPLVAKLVAEGRVANGTPAVVEQGHGLGRPSRILITIDGADVRISGAGLVVADGTVLIRA